MGVPAGDERTVTTPPDTSPDAEPGRPAAPRFSGRRSRRVAYGVLVLIGVELGLLGAFLSLATISVGGGHLPLGPPLAVAANVVTGLWAVRLMGNRAALVAPAVGWLGIVLLLSTTRPEGDVVVTNSGRGVAFLLGGTASWALVSLVSGWAVRTGSMRGLLRRPARSA